VQADASRNPGRHWRGAPASLRHPFAERAARGHEVALLRRQTCSPLDDGSSRRRQRPSSRVAEEGVLRTPPLSERILASVTRAILLEVLDVEESVCRRGDALSCREAFLASTVREVQPVDAIEGHELDARGPATRHATEVYEEVRRRLGEELRVSRSPSPVPGPRGSAQRHSPAPRHLTRRSQS
jgi:hypothetical protein